MTSAPGTASPAPLVAVVIPALNEAGKIGRVLDKMSGDPRFEAIVVDDGSTDGTGDEARRHGAAVVVRHEQRTGVGGAIRDGWHVGLERQRPYLALLSGDDQHEPSELGPALDRLLASGADYVQGSRWMPGGRVLGPAGGRGIGTQFYSAVFSVLDGPAGDRRNERISDLSPRGPRRRADRHRPGMAHELRPGAVCAVQGHPLWVHRHRGSVYRPVPHHGEQYEDAGDARLVATVPARRCCFEWAPSDEHRYQPVVRRAPDPRHRRCRVRRECADAQSSSLRARGSPSSTTCSPASRKPSPRAPNSSTGR